jgi:RHS repeat-associated protein
VGDRTTETQHATTGGPATDTTRVYAPPATGTHDLPKVTQTGTDPHTDTYTYDAAGNTATRTLGADPQQTLNWDPQGHLASVTQDTGPVASYTYDADGNRLTATDVTGTTLYLPDGNELLLKPDNTLVGTRYYTFNGKTVAIRTGGRISFLISDPNGTGTTQIDATTQAVTRRRTTVFGDTRGTPTAPWQGTKGFVGGTTDAATGLTHLGAREYDPTTGRFISVDPVLEPGSPQTLNGYTYGAANPLVYSDPSGMILKCGGDDAACPTHPPADDDTGDGTTATPGTPEDPADASEAKEKWYKVWGPRHDTAVLAATREFQSRYPDDLFDNDAFIRGGSANGKGNAGWADIVQWSDSTVYVWEVKYAGKNGKPGPAASAGPAQLARYLKRLTDMLRADGDNRRVQAGPKLGKVLGPMPNLWNPSEDITVQDGRSPGIITYTWEKNGGRRVPQPEPTPVPVANPKPVPVGTPSKRPKWVSTRPLRPMPVPAAPQAVAPSGGSLMPHADPTTEVATGGILGGLFTIARFLVGVGAGLEQAQTG